MHVDLFFKKTRHFFHVVSNVRPIVWIGLYIALTPVFAVIYWVLPDGQFRIPGGAGTDFGSWLYYSIVTITTLGFGDYTPAEGWAQAFTALEVICGLSVFGFFLNAVGSMKSEIDVESEIEKQRVLHESAEKEKLLKSIPVVLHNINIFLAYCYAVTTPMAKRNISDIDFNPDFRFSDLADLFKPSGLPVDHTRQPAVDRLIKVSQTTSLCLDSLQQRIDLTLWPELLSLCFDFVANTQMFVTADALDTRLHTISTEEGRGLSIAQSEERISRMISECGKEGEDACAELAPVADLYRFIKDNGLIARKIESELTKISA